MADQANKPGFLQYKPENLSKINAMRQAASLVNITGVPTITKAQVCYSTAASAQNEPRSCSNCWMYNSRAKTCRLFGPSLRIEKLIYPPSYEQGGKPVEYWPVCGQWDHGTPNEAVAVYKPAPLDSPDDLGLGWINAPSVGLPHGGSNCGGENGGDDCDNYLIAGDDKRAAPTGFCRVLQVDVANGDCCTAWTDDDFIDWQRAQDLFKELDQRKSGVKTPNPLLPK